MLNGEVLEAFILKFEQNKAILYHHYYLHGLGSISQCN